MSANSDSALSLVERKKLQWAKEKEELAELKAPWRVADEEFNRFGRSGRQMKRGSLPPLYKNQYNSYDKYERGGETSGYGSDNPAQSPDLNCNWNQSGYESSSSKDDRQRWMNKSIGGSAKEEPLKNINVNEPPNWVKRGLENGEIIVNNISPVESPEQLLEEDRPQTSSSYFRNRHKYLRGQNIPIDPVELAERERRRQAAIAHQEAILQQLNEREKKRQLERERRKQEEYEEDMRIAREQELERKRKEQELKNMQEKLEKERKRKEAIEEALEIAQKEAQILKTKQSKHNNYINNLQIKNNVTQNEDKDDQIPEKLNNSECIEKNNNNCDVIETIDNKKLSPRELKVDNSTKSITNNETSVNNVDRPNSQSCPNYISPRIHNNVTLFVPTNSENVQTVQYALIIPTVQPILPDNVPVGKSYCSTYTQTEETIFRNLSSSCENREKFEEEKSTNLLPYEVRRRKERRSRSESLEERPKWGVNRTPARYVKQSDKDLRYSRHNLRKKMTEIKSFEDKNSSDDESHHLSPRFYRKKGSNTKNHTRGKWRKEDILPSKHKLYQTEIIQLESDKDQIYFKSCHCCCRCRFGIRSCSEDCLSANVMKINNSPRVNLGQSEEKLPNLQTNEMLMKLSQLCDGLLMRQNELEKGSDLNM